MRAVIDRFEGNVAVLELNDGESFADLLDRTEEAIACGVERMLSGDVRPDPSSPHACTWCPVLSCAERRA